MKQPQVGNSEFSHLMNSLEVVCALIVNQDGKLLACKRSAKQSHPGKWEFPGGKIEAHETKEQAIIREILEELQIHITPTKQLGSVTHQYPEFHISLSPFLCEISPEVTPDPTEHEELSWLDPLKILPLDLDWAEADIPILQQYILSL